MEVHTFLALPGYQMHQMWRRSTHHNTQDMLYVVTEQCKCAEKNDKFVQDVTCTPEPMAVLCCEQQMNDLIRFCCDPFEFCVLGIDTFI